MNEALQMPDLPKVNVEEAERKVREKDKALDELLSKTLSVQEKTARLQEILPAVLAQLDALDALEERLLELIVKHLEKK